jgi:hypothetical protein
LCDIAEEDGARAAGLAEQHRLVAGGVAGGGDDPDAGGDFGFAVDDLSRTGPSSRTGPTLMLRR